MAFELATPRADAWYAELTEEQLWQLYAVAKRTRDWTVPVKVAREEFKVERKISRTAFYRWRDWMRGQDHDRRLASARATIIETEEMAKKAGISDETMAEAYKTLAAEAYFATNDEKKASRLVNMSAKIASVAIEREKLRLAKAKGERDDRALALAREKFEAAEKRLNAVQGAVDAPQLTDAERVAKIKSIFGMK